MLPRDACEIVESLDVSRRLVGALSWLLLEVRESPEVSASVVWLARQIGREPRTVRAQLRALERAGFLAPLGLTSGGLPRWRIAQIARWVDHAGATRWAANAAAAEAARVADAAVTRRFLEGLDDAANRVPAPAGAGCEGGVDAPR